MLELNRGLHESIIVGNELSLVVVKLSERRVHLGLTRLDGTKLDATNAVLAPECATASESSLSGHTIYLNIDLSGR